MKQTIGIIGGGQLGMYLSLAACQLGYKTVVYDQSKEVSAANLCDIFVEGSFNDKNKLEEFCKLCDVITYEFENINSNIVEELSQKYNIVQKAKPLILSSSRLNEKELAKKLDIKTINWQYIESKEQEIILNYPYIMKSVSLGYDGKGQYKIYKKEDLVKVDFTNTTYMCEELLDFDYEISVIAIKSINDELKFYEPFSNLHVNGILHMTTLEKQSNSIIKQANEIVKKIIDENNIYGILCVEFFVKDGIVYFNEIAARPHNSGHITMDTHITSQYHNHIKAITGEKLGSTAIKCNAVMVNILGQDLDKLKLILNQYGDSINYYDYRKTPKHNRKIGHLVDYNLENIQYYKNNFR
ncbi:5-(carboxyamino)imidazole ribonucleotide synthase [Mycoplasma sp. P36-A1]|uniref:5-(carboxyamino)imidazole ribonucleotide synthase n=1 Tax=Mycoplasma sp. P36-A1 TaxID=3252900 RepID=UPI003C2E7EB6